jgi:ABC-type lipoprotein export system ATPase subunit
VTKPAAASLRFEDVSVGFGGHAVLHGINLHVDGGIPLGVHGPSGGGKTALCLTAAGLAVPSRGHVRFVVNGTESPFAEWAHRVGLILQTHGLVDGLTAQETVSLPLQAIGAGSRAIERCAREALDSVALLDHASRFVEDLSGGERQRVGIARALAIEPVILVADEPTAELDPDNRKHAIDLLLTFASSGRVLLIASDDAEVLSSCGSTARLQEGKLVQW